MSKPIPVHIYFVLDRSGSMASIQQDVIGGFNRFVEEQREQDGKCRLTLVQFDSNNPHEIVYDAVKINDVQPLTSDTFQPRGTTPLLDAEGWTLNRITEREAQRKADGKKDEAVLFVTFTDGAENASREWTREALAAAKKAAEERGVAFTYLGAGHDAYGQARSVGVAGASVQNFAADSKGVAATYGSLSDVSRKVRSRAAGGQRVASVHLYDGIGKTAEDDARDRGLTHSGS
jgi:uncharacterized protein YegL